MAKQKDIQQHDALNAKATRSPEEDAVVKAYEELVAAEEALEVAQEALEAKPSIEV